MVLGVFKCQVKQISAVLFKGFMQGSIPCLGTIGSNYGENP
nr:MAG TPA: hypothetical protein [Caudoviricetes sp.]